MSLISLIRRTRASRARTAIALIVAMSLAACLMFWEVGRVTHHRPQESDVQVGAIGADSNPRVSGWASVAAGALRTPCGLPSRVRRLKDGAEMVLVPAGTFIMGPPEGDRTAQAPELPRHAVTLTSPYYLDVNEVTNGQFEEFVRATGYVTTAEVEGFSKVPIDAGWYERQSGVNWRTQIHEKAPVEVWRRLPVAFVSYTDATAFSRWAGGALPTEAQFERALKFDAEPDWMYPWGNSPLPPSGFGNYFGVECLVGPHATGAAGVIWDYDDHFKWAAPVRSFRPNSLGIFDLSGNVHEFVLDFFDPHAYKDRAEVDPVGPLMGEMNVLRGGAYLSGEVDLRNYRRDEVSKSIRDVEVGFRVAKTMSCDARASHR